MNVPERCRVCAHWLGHLSGDPDDKRCNRNWGHELEWGLFADADDPWSRAAYVEPDCRVPLWGPPLPRLDEHGNATGPAEEPVLVDAFHPAALPYLDVADDYGRGVLTRTELDRYLNMAKTKTRLQDFWAARNKTRDAREAERMKTYEAKFGAAPRLVTPGQLPPWSSFSERIPTGNAVFDFYMGGGYPVGVRCLLGGKPNGGKSTLMDLIAAGHIRYYAANSQDPAGEQILFYKTEGFDPSWFQYTTGLTPEQAEAHVRLATDDLLESFLQDVVESGHTSNASFGQFHGPDVMSYMLPLEYRFVGWDSIDASVYKDEVLGKGGKTKQIDDANRVGGRELLLSEFCRKAYGLSKSPISAVMIAQDRATNLASPTGAKSKYRRGNAIGYFDQLEMWAWCENPNSKAGQAKSSLDVTWRVDKIKFRARVKDGDTFVMPRRKGAGYLAKDAAAQLAKDLGLLDVSGSWWTLLDADGAPVQQNGSDVRAQGVSDSGKIADELEARGLVETTYNNLMILAERDYPLDSYLLPRSGEFFPGEGADTEYEEAD